MMYLGADGHNDLYPIYDANAESVKEEEKEYTLQDLTEINEKRRELDEELHKLNISWNRAERQLRNELSAYFEGVPKINIYDDTTCEVIVETVYLDKLDKLKEDFNLQDIKLKAFEKQGLVKMKVELIW